MYKHTADSSSKRISRTAGVKSKNNGRTAFAAERMEANAVVMRAAAAGLTTPAPRAAVAAMKRTAARCLPVEGGGAAS